MRGYGVVLPRRLHDKLMMDRRFPWIFVDTVNNLFGWSLKVKFQES